MTAAGKRFGCHFTLEYSFADGKAPALGDNIFTLGNSESLDSVLTTLHRELKDFTILQSGNHPRTFHVVQNDLYSDSTYPLNAVVSLDYSGYLEGFVVSDGKGGKAIDSVGLLRSLAKLVKGIQGGYPDGRQGGFEDCETRITIHARNKSVREILTEGLPVTKYKPLLWRSVRMRVGGENAAVVQFFGPER